MTSSACPAQGEGSCDRHSFFNRAHGGKKKLHAVVIVAHASSFVALNSRSARRLRSLKRTARTRQARPTFAKAKSSVTAEDHPRKCPLRIVTPVRGYYHVSTKPNENQGDTGGDQQSQDDRLCVLAIDEETEDESSESVREREGKSDGSELGRRQPYLIDGERLGGLEVCARQIEAAVDNGEDGVSRQKLRQPLIPRMGIYIYPYGVCCYRYGLRADDRCDGFPTAFVRHGPATDGPRHWGEN